MTDDLVQFLRARLDEDQAVALEAPQGPWHIGNAVDPTQPCNVHTFPGARMVADGLHCLVAEHIARHDPDRVLREVEAKRQLLDNLLPDAAGADEQINDEWRAGSTLADDLLCIMALAYSDHPDYRREEWRP